MRRVSSAAFVTQPLRLSMMTNGSFKCGTKPLISATYPLAQAPRALQDLIERKVKGKVVLVVQ